jgi:integrase
MCISNLFYCGLRNGELRGLTWNDIDFNRSTLTVNKNIVKVPDPKTVNLIPLLVLNKFKL